MNPSRLLTSQWAPRRHRAKISALVVVMYATSAIETRAPSCFADLPTCSASGGATCDATGITTKARLPDGLAASDWSIIGAAYEANRHAAYALEGGFQARNPGQHWRTFFDGRGFVTTPDGGDRNGGSPSWSWGLDLLSYGVGTTQPVGSQPACVEANGTRVEYQWDDALTEWYINDQRGLEHGYTVHRRPSSSHDDRPHFVAAHKAEPLLRFTLAVRGNLSLQISDAGRDVTFVNESGAAVVTYSGLKVFDADGTDVPAWFENVDAGLLLNVDDSAARYPLTIDPTAQQAYLKASNTGADDLFGHAVAISGDTVVVGAPQEDSSATGVNGNQASNTAPNSGAAYVFVRNGTTWTQQAYLKASNASVISSDDRFGQSVAISGDTVVVGANREDSNATGVNGNQNNDSALESGAAYVFVRSGTTWSQQAYLKSSNTGDFDFFGWSVSVSGNTVVVGAYPEDSNATGVNGNQADNSASASGAAYVFVRSGTTWSQQAYLKASNTDAFDKFGWSVGASGDTVVVGAYEEDSNATGVNGNQGNNVEASGAAYVFFRSGTSWSQQAYLKASNTGNGDWFGYSLSMSGDTIVVGSPFESSIATGVNGDQNNDNHPSAGAAYVFVRDGTTWTQQAYVKASNTPNLNDPFAGGDLFGVSVSVSADLLVVGATSEDSNATGVNGNQLDNTAFDSGAAYVFSRSGTTWSQQAYLKASNSETNDFFGEPVAVSGNTVVVGTPVEDSNATGVNGTEASNSAADSGAAYVFLIEPCANIGDMNCDCAVNIADIPPFVQALVDPAGFTGCNILNGDMQPDGNVNGLDVQGFAALLVP